jgi:hypothetical protein
VHPGALRQDAAQAAVAARHEAIGPDDLFRTLDGRELTALGQRWTIEVYGVRDEQGHRWVQLRLNRPSSSRWLVLRLPAGAGERHAILAATTRLTFDFKNFSPEPAAEFA